jgi:hypothetical protein
MVQEFPQKIASKSLNSFFSDNYISSEVGLLKIGGTFIWLFQSCLPFSDRRHLMMGFRIKLRVLAGHVLKAAVRICPGVLGIPFFLFFSKHIIKEKPVIL